MNKNFTVLEQADKAWQKTNLGINPASSVETAQLRLWLVDDNDRHRQLFARKFEQKLGLACVGQFASAEAAILALGKVSPPEVILMDVEMPEMNGATAVKTSKALSPGIKIFMFSTFFNASRAVEARKGGASGYFRKSDIGQVMQMLRTLLHPVVSDFKPE